MLKNNKGGIGLVATMMAAVVLAIAGIGIISLSYSHYKIVKDKSVDKERAYHFALGNINKAVYEYQKDGDFVLEDSAGNSVNIAAIALGPVFIKETVSSSWNGLNRKKVRVIAACAKNHSSVSGDGICINPGITYQPGNSLEYEGKLKPGDYVIESVVDY